VVRRSLLNLRGYDRKRQEEIVEVDKYRVRFSTGKAQPVEDVGVTSLETETDPSSFHLSLPYAPPRSPPSFLTSVALLPRSSCAETSRPFPSLTSLCRPPTYAGSAPADVPSLSLPSSTHLNPNRGRRPQRMQPVSNGALLFFGEFQSDASTHSPCCCA
jgi:hypothetical protein